MPHKIGLMVGREWSFPPAFVEEVSRREKDIVVEYLKLATPTLRDPIQYSVIVDRISNAVPFYRAWLKHASLRGVRVLNDPSTWFLDDRFTLAGRAAELNVQVPRTVILPHREYREGIVHEESLRNLDYPLDWAAVVEYVGLPCLLKDARESGEPAHVCHSQAELLQYYNASGQKLLIVQEIIPCQQYVRCFVVGQEVLPLKYDPVHRKYHVDHEHLSPELGLRIVDESRRIVGELGFDINAIDWAIRDGTPYAVELLNPMPEIDIYALTPEYFDWVVQQMAEFAIGAITGRGSVRPGPAANTAGGGDLAQELPSLARDL